MRPLTCCLLALVWVLFLSMVAGIISRAAERERDRTRLAYPQEYRPVPLGPERLVWITESIAEE